MQRLGVLGEHLIQMEDQTQMPKQLVMGSAWRPRSEHTGAPHLRLSEQAERVQRVPCETVSWGCQKLHPCHTTAAEGGGHQRTFCPELGRLKGPQPYGKKHTKPRSAESRRNRFPQRSTWWQFIQYQMVSPKDIQVTFYRLSRVYLCIQKYVHL